MRSVLKDRNFRRLLSGRIITNAGDSMYFIASMWLVYSLTNSPFYSGIAGFLVELPAMFQFLTGPFVDDWNLRRTLVGTQLVQVILVAVIPISSALGMLRVELILVILPLSAAINQFVYPAEAAAIPRLLDDEELVSANSLLSATYQGIDMTMNGISGVLIGIIGAVTLFVVDSITFLVSAMLFATIAIPDASSTDEETTTDPDESVVADEDGISNRVSNYSSDLLDGVSFIRGTFIVWLVAGAAVVNLAYGMVLASLPAYASNHSSSIALSAVSGAGTYGILMAAITGGSFVGVLLANVISNRPLGPTMVVNYGISGILWGLAIVVNWIPLTALFLFFSTIPVSIVNIQMLAVIQSAPPKDYVGRVSSLLGSASTMGIPFGSLIGGYVAGQFSPKLGMSFRAIFVFGFALFVYLRPSLRQLPEPTEITFEA